MSPVSATVVPRRVRFDHEDMDAVRMMIRFDADPPVLVAGLRIEVEVGARWITKDGHTERVSGQWLACDVVSDTPRELVVRLADN
jgi:hypothetical protein